MCPGTWISSTAAGSSECQILKPVSAESDPETLVAEKRLIQLYRLKRRWRAGVGPSDIAAQSEDASIRSG
jgi:hypothetical protein